MKRRVMIGIGSVACIAIGWVASAAEHTAHAQVPAARAGEWVDMGEANGVQAFRFSDQGRVCYVTTPNGGISCGR